MAEQINVTTERILAKVGALVIENEELRRIVAEMRDQAAAQKNREDDGK